MTAIYNEYDPFAAAWLRELIKAGHIAPGEVDERSIVDVGVDDYKDFTQVHMFAGIGVWSLALRQSGYPDDGPIWTGSCPCPPFSSAGPDFRCPECDTRSPVPNAVRTGAFDCIRCGHEWQADMRHLWPEFFRLIRHNRPELVLGEQVASADGRTWIDVVRASLEMLGYAVGHPDVPASGFGAPHIRQRLYWVADAASGRRQSIPIKGQSGLLESQAGEWDIFQSGDCGAGNDRMADTYGKQRYGIADGKGREPYGTQAGWEQSDNISGTSSKLRRLANSNGRNTSAEGQQCCWQQRQQPQDSGIDLLGNPIGQGLEGHWRSVEERDPFGWESADGHGATSGECDNRPGPTNGYWQDADWLRCTDEKWRAVEPATFPLVDAGTFRNRVGMLRGAGNAITIAQAEGFIRAVMECRP